MSINIIRIKPFGSDGVAIDLQYDQNGKLTHAIDKTNHIVLTIEYVTSPCVEYTLQQHRTASFGTLPTLDARMARIIELGVFVPYRLFVIANIEPK